jgi:hypothetical protein
MFPSLFSCGRTPVPTELEAGLAPGPVRTLLEKTKSLAPVGIRTLNPAASAHEFYLRAVLIFPALKQNLACHRFKDNREVEAIVTRWVIAQDMEWYWQGIRKARLTI